MLQVGALWALLPTWPLLLLCLARNHRRTAAALGVVALVHVGWALDFFPRRWGHSSPTDGVHLRLVSANVLAPHPSPALGRSLREYAPDVLVVTELSDEWLVTLEEEGALDALPHRALWARPTSLDYFGIGIASRFPILASERVDIGTPALQVDLDVDGARLRLWAVHPPPPSTERTLAMLRTSLASIAACVAAAPEGLPLIVAGDLNTSPQTRELRQLLATTRLVAAHDLAGSPFARTWPMRGWRVPPLVRLDHVLLRGVGARAVREGESMTSDHAPLVVDLVVPTDH